MHLTICMSNLSRNIFEASRMHLDVHCNCILYNQTICNIYKETETEYQPCR